MTQHCSQLHIDLPLPSTSSGLQALASGPASSTLTVVHISNSSYSQSAAAQLLRSCRRLKSLTLLPRAGGAADDAILRDQRELREVVQQGLPLAQLLPMVEAFAAGNGLL